jgi:hypothetical protein
MGTGVVVVAVGGTDGDDGALDDGGGPVTLRGTPVGGVEEGGADDGGGGGPERSTPHLAVGRNPPTLWVPKCTSICTKQKLGMAARSGTDSLVGPFGPMVKFWFSWWVEDPACRDCNRFSCTCSVVGEPHEL